MACTCIVEIPCAESVEVKLHAFITLALDGDEWSAKCSVCFTLGEKTVWYTLDSRLCGPRSIMDDIAKRKTLSLLGIEY